MPEIPSFDLVLTRAPGRVSLVLAGELDIASSRRLTKYLAQLARTYRGAVVIDLRELTFIDSTGIGALAAAARHARRDGWDLTIVKGPPPIHRVLDLCGTLPLSDAPPGEEAVRRSA